VRVAPAQGAGALRRELEDAGRVREVDRHAAVAGDERGELGDVALVVGAEAADGLAVRLPSSSAIARP
jgi:hypothetical protein